MQHSYQLWVKSESEAFEPTSSFSGVCVGWVNEYGLAQKPIDMINNVLRENTP